MRELRQFGVHVANGILPVFIFVGLLLACGCVTEEDEPEWSLGVGDRLPDFSVETIVGEVVSAEGLRGRVAVVVLFNTSCPDCQTELPRVQAVYEKMMAEEPEGVGFLCISRQEGRGAVVDYWAANGLTLPVAPQEDRVVYEKFASVGIPRIYVADGNGVIVAAFSDRDLPSAGEIADAISVGLSTMPRNW